VFSPLRTHGKPSKVKKLGGQTDILNGKPLIRTKQIGNKKGVNYMINIQQNELLTKYQPNKYHPFLYALNTIKPEDWFLFGSLTWEKESRRCDSPRAQKYREDDFNTLMNMFCKNFKLRPKNIAYYRTTEFGAAGEAHFHFLITKNRLADFSPESCANALERLWTRELKPFDSKCPGIGMAEIKPYDAAREDRGIKYCLKREFDEFYQPRERYDFLSKPLINLINTNNSNLPDASLN
jgi:hypothetical protein